VVLGEAVVVSFLCHGSGCGVTSIVDWKVGKAGWESQISAAEEKHW
jgi:hypothetical protein